MSHYNRPNYENPPHPNFQNIESKFVKMSDPNISNIHLSSHNMINPEGFSYLNNNIPSARYIGNMHPSSLGHLNSTGRVAPIPLQNSGKNKRYKRRSGSGTEKRSGTSNRNDNNELDCELREVNEASGIKTVNCAAFVGDMYRDANYPTNVHLVNPYSMMQQPPPSELSMVPSVVTGQQQTPFYQPLESAYGVRTVHAAGTSAYLTPFQLYSGMLQPFILATDPQDPGTDSRIYPSRVLRPQSQMQPLQQPLVMISPKNMVTHSRIVNSGAPGRREATLVQQPETELYPTDCHTYVPNYYQAPQPQQKPPQLHQPLPQQPLSQQQFYPPYYSQPPPEDSTEQVMTRSTFTVRTVHTAASLDPDSDEGLPVNSEAVSRSVTESVTTTTVAALPAVSTSSCPTSTIGAGQVLFRACQLSDSGNTESGTNDLDDAAKPRSRFKKTRISEKIERWQRDRFCTFDCRFRVIPSKIEEIVKVAPDYTLKDDSIEVAMNNSISEHMFHQHDDDYHKEFKFWFNGERKNLFGDSHVNNSEEEKNYCLFHAKYLRLVNLHDQLHSSPSTSTPTATTTISPHQSPSQPTSTQLLVHQTVSPIPALAAIADFSPLRTTFTHDPSPSSPTSLIFTHPAHHHHHHQIHPHPHQPQHSSRQHLHPSTSANRQPQTLSPKPAVFMVNCSTPLLVHPTATDVFNEPISIDTLSQRSPSKSIPEDGGVTAGMFAHPVLVASPTFMADVSTPIATPIAAATNTGQVYQPHIFIPLRQKTSLSASAILTQPQPPCCCEQADKLMSSPLSAVSASDGDNQLMQTLSDEMDRSLSQFKCSVQQIFRKECSVMQREMQQLRTANERLNTELVILQQRTEHLEKTLKTGSNSNNLGSPSHSPSPCQTSSSNSSSLPYPSPTLSCTIPMTTVDKDTTDIEKLPASV